MTDDAITSAIQRGKCWVHRDGSTSPREPMPGSIFWRSDGEQLEVYAEHKEPRTCTITGMPMIQLWPTPEQMHTLTQLLIARVTHD